MRPGSLAATGSMCPEPVAKTLAFFPSYPSKIGFPFWSVIYVVVMIAEIIAATDHVGWLFLSRAARPATCGVAIEQPL
ncbi:hypothetical protein IEQ34_005826 [Dendrobium chrysotoxum]|uniref:Uncharacterized protein n=1 Tax=Dendrobium chrysotoxum TaxID=161865 RepID=A0AAV7HE49_DENCH|nr:hypothetical protein IEQ34_005826 [Dendrobium chrysotoxum]